MWCREESSGNDERREMREDLTSQTNQHSERDVFLPDPGVRKNLVKENEVVCR